MTHARPAATSGIVLHRPAAYDLLLSVLTLGREQRLRARALDLAQIKPGDSVLDVGCGTGTLAIAAKTRVGPSGTVCGIDASPEMLGRAIKKAAGAEIEFRNAAVEALPYPDRKFDLVLSTVMLHHLPAGIRPAAASEIARVLKPGGRVLAVDFADSPEARKGLVAHFHRHGRIRFEDMVAMFQNAGFAIEHSGPLGIAHLSFIRARVPASQPVQGRL